MRPPTGARARALGALLCTTLCALLVFAGFDGRSANATSWHSRPLEQADDSPSPLDTSSALPTPTESPLAQTPLPGAQPSESASPSESPPESPSPQESTPPPSPQPVTLADASSLVILGHGATVHVLSPVSGLVSLSGFDATIVRAVFNPIDRTIDLLGLRAGSTTITATDMFGLSATLAVTVQAYAGKAYPSTEVSITGDPAAADFVVEEALKAASLVAYPESGARVVTDPTTVRGARQLDGDDATTVYVPLSIVGAGYASYHQTVAVHVINFAQPEVAPTNLLVSDFPETIVENGTLFYADVNFDDPARLLYYHYAAPQSAARRVLVKAQNNTPFTSMLQLISGIAGPDPNILAVGHESTKRFIVHEAAGEGEIFSVPANATVNVVDQLLPGGALVSGLMQIRVVNGAGVRVAVVVQDAADTPIGPISDTLLSSAVKHARGVYQVPEFLYDISYTVDGDPGELLIGKLPLPNMVQGEVLGGDYGVKQSASVTLLNPTPATRRVGMWFEPRGGRATGTFLIDGQLVQLHPVDPGRPALVRTFDVPAGGYRRITLVTMPEGGSSYPVRVSFATQPPPGGGWNFSSTVY